MKEFFENKLEIFKEQKNHNLVRLKELEDRCNNRLDKGVKKALELQKLNRILKHLNSQPITKLTATFKEEIEQDIKQLENEIRLSSSANETDSDEISIRKQEHDFLTADIEEIKELMRLRT